MDPDIKSKLIAGGVDYEIGVERFGGNEAMFEKFVCRFTQDNHLEEIRRALEQGDAEGAFHQAHTLKGVVGNLSLDAFFDAITPVAEALKEGDIARAESLMPAVEEANTRILKTLETLN